MLRLFVSLLAAASFTQAFDASKLLNEISTSIKERVDEGKQIIDSGKIHIPRIIHNTSVDIEDKIKEFERDRLPHIRPPSPKGHTCAECTRFIGHHLIQASINATIDFCHDTDCPEAKKRCEWMYNNQNFTLGYITEKVEPIKSGRLFCEGRGVCPIHPDDNFIDLMNDDNFFMESGAVLDSITSALDEEKDEDHDAVRIEIASITTPLNDENDNKNDDNQVDEYDGLDIDSIMDQNIGKNELCGLCVSLVTKHILKGALVKTAAFCKVKEHDPVWQPRCQFALSHLDFSAGYLYSKYKPSNTAYGFCYAKKACPHSASALSKHVLPPQVFDINFEF